MFRVGKKFCQGPPPPIKGKIFDTRFGLIHVQTGKKFFVKGTPPPPQVKGKIFDTRFWLDTCSDWKKNFLSRDPPPGIARNCYGNAAGGMPLAFTQEDFLVKKKKIKFFLIAWTKLHPQLRWHCLTSTSAVFVRNWNGAWNSSLHNRHRSMLHLLP